MAQIEIDVKKETTATVLLTLTETEAVALCCWIFNRLGTIVNISTSDSLVTGQSIAGDLYNELNNKLRKKI